LAKKIQFSPAWIIVGIFLFCSLLVVVFLYLRVVHQQQLLNAYNPLASDHQIVDAIVTKSKSWHFTKSSSGGNKGETRIVTTLSERFLIDVSLPDSRTYSAEIIPNRGVNKNFGFSNLYIPSQTELTFAEDNFPEGKQIQVEIWNDKIILLFTKSTLGQHIQGNNQIFVFSPKTPSNSLQADSDTEIVIPTREHPIIALENAQNNFDGAIVAVIMLNIPVLLLAIRFRKVEI
jgi:hypothetical protein